MNHQHSFKVIIPARGNSKGLPNKNIMLLKGKPMILYTIEAARKIFADNDIIVSTDSKLIRDLVQNHGLNVNRLRPSNLAEDDSSTFDVVMDIINVDFDEIPDYLLILQPTSPLRNENHIREALKLVNEDTDMIVSVSESHLNPYWNLFEENINGNLIKCKEGFFSRRQDVPKVYAYNGAIYIIKTLSLLKNKSFQFPKILKYLMDKNSSVDIDDFVDFKIAEILMDTDEKN